MNDDHLHGPVDGTPTADLARAHLARADESASRLHADGRWAATSLLLFGIAFGALTVALGLPLDRPVKLVVVVLGWGGAVLALTTWARRRPVSGAGSASRWSRAWAVTLTLYAVTIAVSGGREGQIAAFWLPAAVVVALPFVVQAVRQRAA